MKKSKKIILKSITALMIVSCVALVNGKLTYALSNERAYIETVKSMQFDDYMGGDYIATKYSYKNLTFQNTYWFIDKTFYKTVWYSPLAWQHQYQFNYGTK